MKLTPTHKIAAVAAGGVGLFFLLRKLFKKENKPSPIPTSDDNHVYTGNTIKEVTVVASRNQSITQAEAYDLADELYKAMDGFGTDEDAIFAVASKLKTVQDWEAVKQAFGFKPYSVAYATPSLLSNDGYSDIMAGVPINLKNWLLQELSDSDRSELLRRLPSGCQL